MSMEFLIDAAQGGRRLDAVVAEHTQLTRSYVQQLMAQGCVLYNGTVAAKSLRAGVGAQVSVQLPQVQAATLQAQPIPLKIVYEDSALLVVDKPKGMVVHPAPGNPDGTLVNALMYHCQGRLSAIHGELRPGIVHRIDKDTSGLLVVAKSNEAHLALCEQFACHSITRVYRTIVYGGFARDEGTIEGLIGRHPVDRKKMAVVHKHGKHAFTQFCVERRFRGFTQLRIQLKTGRTHQIRVHMASIGHPVAGDAVYGPRKVIQSLKGQCLHAGVLGFVHPNTKQHMEFESELPAYFRQFAESMEQD